MTTITMTIGSHTIDFAGSSHALPSKSGSTHAVVSSKSPVSGLLGNLQKKSVIAFCIVGACAFATAQTTISDPTPFYVGVETVDAEKGKFFAAPACL